MASLLDDINKLNKGAEKNDAEKYNEIGNIQSVLAGIPAGLIAIPKGLFSLGASLMDLGAETDKAAQVEKWFDDLTEFDEMAEATAAGKITQVLVNLGVPGVGAWSKGASLASKAIQSKKLGKYFVANNDRVLAGMDKAAILNRRGQTAKYMAASTASGLADGIFVGDVEQIGTFGDLIGGPTELERDDGEYDAERQLINRIKFGTEGALFTGVLVGAGKTLKKLAKRNEADRYSTDELVRLHDRFLSKIASKGKTPSLFPSIEKQTGRIAADTNVAKNTNLELSKHIDGIFPLWRPMAQKLTEAQRKETLELLDLSFRSASSPSLKFVNLAPKGTPIKDISKFRKAEANFGPMDEVVTHRGKKVNVAKKLEEYGMLPEDIKGTFASLSLMRGRMGSMISDTLNVLKKEDLDKYMKIPGTKLKNYISSTYDLFSHKAGVLHRKYPPASAAMNKAKELFKRENRAHIARVTEENINIVRGGGKPLPVPAELTDEMAEMHVNKFLKEDVLPGQLKLDFKSTEPIIKLPSWFNTKSMLDDVDNMGRKGFTPLDNVTSADRKIFEDLFGKQKDVMKTILSSTGKLSLITRKNQYYGDIVKANDELSKVANKEIADAAAKGVTNFVPKTKQIFFDDLVEAQQKTGLSESEFKQIGKEIGVGGESIDPSKKFASGLVNAIDGKYALREVAEAFDSTTQLMKNQSNVSKLYQNLVLYPKATSQMAKTILSPITHARNFISAGAFATANGIIPNPDAMKTAYQALQIPLKGSRKQNELYQELLELGVVNSNVRLGDLQNLLTDVKFGQLINENLDSGKFLGRMFNKMSRFKKGAEDFYTAEDDFWKITSWVSEKSRLGRNFEKAGIKPGDMVRRFDGTMTEYGEKFLKEEAADIVKNNIPNYARVSDFVRGLRKLPIGNFVSFPAEILRTSTNIVNRGLKEINYKHTLADGRVVKPLQGIGYQRLAGMGATTVAVPYGVVEAAKMIYDVSEDEMEALRRYVADWSKNSTLVPIKDKETGKFKYVDFSHANAYDTLTRPIQTILNSVASGREDEDGMMDDFVSGLFTATKELGLPFVSESIWTEALSDIYFRRGRTQEGFQVWNPEDTYGDRVYKGLSHLVKSQAPFSWPTLKRLDVAFTPVDIIQDKPGAYDKYGLSYDLSDELQGFFGLRAVEVNPERGLKFKVADFQRRARDSKSLFTRTALRGGPISPEEIVDAYLNANRALFTVKRNFMKDLDGASLMGLELSDINNITNRISKKEKRAIEDGIFRPFTLSKEVRNAFAENAAKIGEEDPYIQAGPVIDAINDILSLAPLSLEMFPEIENPFKTPVSESLSNFVPSNFNLETSMVNPSIVGQGANLTQTGNVMQNGLTQSEMAYYDNEEKLMKLKQRGLA